MRIDKFVCEPHNILSEMKNKEQILTKKEEISLLIKFIAKEFRTDFEARLNAYNLTAQQGRILFFINCRKNKGQSTRSVDIEKGFNLTKSTVHGLVERMIKANVLIKENYHLELTDCAKSLMHHVYEKRIECLDSLLKDVSEEELETLKKILSKIYDNRTKKEDKNI